METMLDWSKLPDDILRSVARRLPTIEDHIRFGGVCKSWHLLTLQREYCSSPSKLPWLMLAEGEEDDGNNDNTHGFFSSSTRRVHQIQLPELHGRRCWGSPHGWLVCLTTTMEMYLLNPLTRAQIPLPPLYKCPNLREIICTPVEYRDALVNKAVLFSSPNSSDCVVMAIYSRFRKMAFVKPGSEAWTPMESDSGPFDDIIFFNDTFLAVNSVGNVVIHDLGGSHVVTIVCAPSPPVDELLYEAKYLVELEGEILMVIRRIFETGITEPLYLKTWGFEVHEVGMSSRICKEIVSLNGGCLFLGNNYSFAVGGADCPEYMKNCICFTDDYIGLINPPSSYDMGIYGLEVHNVEPYPVGHTSICLFCPPFWFKPSFW